MTTRINIFGAGGHARVVASAALAANLEVSAVYDDDPNSAGQDLMGLPLRHYDGQRRSTRNDCRWHIAVGDNDAREHIFGRIADSPDALQSVIHPRASIDPASAIDRGVFVASLAIVAVAATVGQGAIVNHGAIIDHDCRVGRWVHLAPGAVLGGNASVGDGTLIGAGAIVLPGVSIGNRCKVGAGAVVTRDVQDNSVVLGVPARQV